LNYVGSITIDEHILEQVDILPHEKVQIVNNNNGARLETYVIPGKKHSGIICLNEAAARLVQEGDIVIIISYAMLATEEMTTFKQTVAEMYENNHIKQMIDQDPSLTAI